jgi:hypothetical protein
MSELARGELISSEESLSRLWSETYLMSKCPQPRPLSKP